MQEGDLSQVGFRCENGGVSLSHLAWPQVAVTAERALRSETDRSVGLANVTFYRKDVLCDDAGSCRDTEKWLYLHS